MPIADKSNIHRALTNLNASILEQIQEDSVPAKSRLTRKFVPIFMAGLAMLLMLSSFAVAREFEKVPIEQAIKEGREHREQERLAKGQRLAKQRESQEQLGIMGALPTQYQYDVKFYRIDLNVNVTTEIIVGRVDMTSTATQDNVTFCQVDLYSNLTVDSVRVDGVLATFTRSGNLVTANLPSTKNTGEAFTVSTYYQGHPIEGGFQAFSFDTFAGNPVVTTLSEPYLARTWWPCKDYPDDKADSVDIIITYPSNLFCSSNGTMFGDIDNGNGTRTTYWRIAIRSRRIWSVWRCRTTRIGGSGSTTPPVIRCR